MHYLTFEQAKARQAELITVWTETSRAWKAVPGTGTGPLGLTPDAVKFGPKYRSAKRAYEIAAAELRAFDSQFVKRFKAELRTERRARYTAA